MLGVSIDPWPSQGAYAKSLGLSFPLLSDWPQYETCKQYDVWQEDRRVAKRVAYAVDKQGIIRGVVEDQREMQAYSRETLRMVKETEGVA